jgi:hypothetical protein
MAGVLKAQSISGDVGNSWLKIDPSTRNASMGEVLGAVQDDADAVDINPAGIGLGRGGEISFSQNFWAQGLSVSHLVYNQSLGNGDGFSLAGDYTNFGTIPIYTVTGSVIAANGSESPMGLNFYAGYGLHLGAGWRLGLTAHYIYDNIQPSFPGSTGAVDGGLLYQIPGTGLALSGVLSDLGSNLDTASLPLQLKTGAAYSFGNESSIHALTLAAQRDWSLISASVSSFGVGAEYWYENLIAVRAGYRITDSGSVTGVTGLTFGAGVRYKDWQLDYAMATMGDFGTSNQIALSLKLGGDGKPAAPASQPAPTSGDN